MGCNDELMTERPADECRPSPEVSMPHWPFAPLTPMQQQRIEAQRKAIFGEKR